MTIDSASHQHVQQPPLEHASVQIRQRAHGVGGDGELDVGESLGPVGVVAREMNFKHRPEPGKRPAGKHGGWWGVSAPAVGALASAAGTHSFTSSSAARKGRFRTNRRPVSDTSTRGAAAGASFPPFAAASSFSSSSLSLPLSDSSDVSDRPPAWVAKGVCVRE